jgi:hypothetical protein
VVEVPQDVTSRELRVELEHGESILADPYRYPNEQIRQVAVGQDWRFGMRPQR